VVEGTPIVVEDHVPGASEQQPVAVEPHVVEGTPIAVEDHVPGAAKEAVVLVAPAAEVDWTKLPSDNLRAIPNFRATNTLDLARFRLTCSSWRSIVVPTYPEFDLYIVPGITPRLNLNPSAELPFRASNWNRQSILLLTPPTTNSSQNQQPWLINMQLNTLDPIGATLWHPIPIRPNINIKLRYFGNDELLSKTLLDLTKFSL
jgi:hypothetical protein